MSVCLVMFITSAWTRWSRSVTLLFLYFILLLPCIHFFGWKLVIVQENLRSCRRTCGCFRRMCSHFKGTCNRLCSHLWDCLKDYVIAETTIHSLQGMWLFKTLQFRIVFVDCHCLSMSVGTFDLTLMQKRTSHAI